jgi:hypothetical protein
MICLILGCLCRGVCWSWDFGGRVLFGSWVLLVVGLCGLWVCLVLGCVGLVLFGRGFCLVFGFVGRGSVWSEVCW